MLFRIKKSEEIADIECGVYLFVTKKGRVGMKVSNQCNIVIGTAGKQGQQIQEKQHKKEAKTNCFAGNLNSDLFQNELLEKKKEARKKAMQVVGNAFNADQEIDLDLQERREKISYLNQENQKLLKQIEEIDESQKQLMEQYGISEDSQEQKDLELLRKKDRWLRGKGEALTKEELEYVGKLEKEGLTDYQRCQREWDKEKNHFQSQVDKNNLAIIEENAIIRGMKLERLKHMPMVKAQKEAEEIIENAGKEIIGMIVEEAKDTMEEKSEEEQEKAEKLEEQQKEREAFIQKQKEKNEEAEEFIENMPIEEILQIGQLKDEIKQEIKNIMNEMKLVAEDIKGAMVDESL